jgi:hypothetical protein
MTDSNDMYKKGVEITMHTTLYWNIPISYSPLAYMKFLNSLSREEALSLANNFEPNAMEVQYD